MPTAHTVANLMDTISSPSSRALRVCLQTLRGFPILYTSPGTYQIPAMPTSAYRRGEKDRLRFRELGSHQEHAALLLPEQGAAGKQLGFAGL